MVKNIPTIERSTKIRFGKHVSDSQAENTIVFNASNTAINATNSGSMYMAPLRVAEIASSNLLSYSPSTKEVVDSSVPTTLLGGVTLQSATENGNTTDKFIGIQNTAPTHAISVADKVFIHNVNSIDRITVVGNVRATNYSTTADAVLIQDSDTNKIQVSGRIHSSELTTSKIGLANTAPDHVISIGNEGQVQLNVPTQSIYALDTVGNVNAQNYRGDSYYLSNLTVENIVNQGNVTSNTVQFTNGRTSIYTSSNVDVGGNIFVRNNTDSAIYGTIAGANTIAGSTITAVTQFSGPGTGLTGIPTNQFASGAIPFSSGGTGHDTYIPGTILYGTDTGTSLGRLVPAVSNQDAGKFLRLDASDIPEWAEVPLTLDAVLGDTTAISDGSMDLTGTGTTITTAGKIKAASFEGVGSEIEGINAANVASLSGSTLVTGVLPIVPVTKGGTGLTTVAQNDLLLGPSSGDALAKLSAYTGPTSITAPPSGMTSTTQTIGGIQYTSSASSTMSGTTTYNAFDYNNTTIWRSGILDDYSDMDGYYEGSTTTGSYSGEWIQIYRATAIAPTSIQIIPAQTTHAAPNVWKVFGSTNGSSWTEIHSSTTAVTWNSGNGHTATISGSAAYNYLRLAVQMSTIPNSLGTIAVSEVRFSAQGTGPTEKFLRSSAAGVSWDAVSSTLQTITDGGASTTNEISFTNGVTSLTASGNVVVTGNVTASTFKSTTLTSGKIPYTNANKELIDGPIGHDSTTNNTFVSSNLYVTGNLTVQGTTTFQDSNIHTVSDPIIEIGNANAIDTIDMGVIMTRPTANVVSGYMGDEKKYVIAYTLSDPDGAHIVPTNATSDQFMTLSVEGGNVLAGNVTTTGLVEATTLKGDGSDITHLNLGGVNNYGQVAAARGGTGVTSGLTQLDAENITTGVLDVARGGTNIGTYSAGDLLYASSDATPVLTKLSPNNGKFLKSTTNSVEWADVSSTLDDVASNGPAGANITSNTIQFTNTGVSLTASGDITIAATKKIDFATDIIFESAAGTSTDKSPLKIINAIEVDPDVVSGGISSRNVLAINHSTGEIYDSGGQGGSTLDNIHEEGSNVSIGPSAWAGPTGTSNLTMNTYGSNVLTVTGNVSATNITIGALHVAASPFDLDDVCSGSVGANVITSNVIQFTGPHASYGDNNFTTSKSISIGSNVNVTGNIFVGVDTTISGNVVSQNLQLTNTQIASSFTTGSGTLTIDCKNKSYGTAPLTTIDADVAILSISNLPSGGQVVVPLLASGSDRKVLKTITSGIDFIAFTTDVSIAQSGHGLLTVSKIGASGAEKIYMNAIAFTAA